MNAALQEGTVRPSKGAQHPRSYGVKCRDRWRRRGVQLSGVGSRRQLCLARVMPQHLPGRVAPPTTRIALDFGNDCAAAHGVARRVWALRTLPGGCAAAQGASPNSPSTPVP